VRRGFKSEAGRVADRVRSALGQGAAESLDPEAVAAYLGARVVAADTLVARVKLKQLEAIQDDAFSAVTFKLPDSQVVTSTIPSTNLVDDAAMSLTNSATLSSSTRHERSKWWLATRCSRAIPNRRKRLIGSPDASSYRDPC
jgi:hypothetical protein